MFPITDHHKGMSETNRVFAKQILSGQCGCSGMRLLTHTVFFERNGKLYCARYRYGKGICCGYFLVQKLSVAIALDEYLYQEGIPDAKLYTSYLEPYMNVIRVDAEDIPFTLQALTRLSRHAPLTA